MKLLLATHNKNKVIELQALLNRHPEIEVVTLDDLGITQEPEETEPTFAGNAALKARWAAMKSGILAMADDSGLEIDALNKEPGVYSARYLGKDTPYELKNAIILQRMANSTDRRARFISVVAIADPKTAHPASVNTDIILCEGIMEGSIAFEQKGSNGFGYDPIFIPSGSTQTYAQMSTPDKNKVSHRAQAFRQAVKALIRGETE